MQSLYYTLSDIQREARDATTREWRQAAAEKRIKTRKLRGRSSVHVWLEPRKQDQPRMAA